MDTFEARLRALEVVRAEQDAKFAEQDVKFAEQAAEQTAIRAEQSEQAASILKLEEGLEEVAKEVAKEIADIQQSTKEQIQRKLVSIWAVLGRELSTMQTPDQFCRVELLAQSLAHNSCSCIFPLQVS